MTPPNTVKKETRKGSIPRKTQTVDYDGLKNIRMSTRTLHKYLETSVYPPSFAQFLSFPPFLTTEKRLRPFLPDYILARVFFFFNVLLHKVGPKKVQNCRPIRPKMSAQADFEKSLVNKLRQPRPNDILHVYAAQKSSHILKLEMVYLG